MADEARQAPVVWTGPDERGRSALVFADGRVEPAWDTPTSCVDAMIALGKALADAQAERDVLKADNAALLLLATERGCLDLGHTVEPEDPDSCNEQRWTDAASCPACRATRTEHPGTLLLRELRALRERVATLEKEKTNAEDTRDALGPALVEEQEHRAAAEAEAATAREQVESLGTLAQESAAAMDRVWEALGGKQRAKHHDAADLVRALRESHAQQVRRADAAPDVALEVAALVADAEAQRAGDAAEDAEKRMAVLPGHAARARVIAATGIARDIRALMGKPVPAVLVSRLTAHVETYEAECGALAEPLESADPEFVRIAGNAEGARELLRRVAGGQVPEVLAKALVAEALRGRRYRSAPTYYEQGANAALDDVAEELGVTLSTSKPHAG